jgi:hypothetical protein
MKQRFGGLLALALGAVLIGHGITAGADGGAGVAPPGAGCGTASPVGITPVDQCPTGTIVITETTAAAVTPPPGGWQVTITSTCIDPLTSDPVNRTLTVPDGGSATSFGLYIFQYYGGNANSPKCLYVLAETPVPGVTATFTPAPEVQIGFDANSQSARTVAVGLANAATVPTTTPPTTTAAPSTTASVPAEPSATGSGPQTDFTDTAEPPSDSAGAGAGGESGGSQAAAPIAETGPSQSVTVSLWLGIGLLFLGLFLLFEGRVPRLGRHRD